MTSPPDPSSARRRVRSRQDEHPRHASRSLRGSSSGNVPVMPFGLENVRIGGNETKLRNHYGYDAKDLQSTPYSQANPTVPVYHSVGSNETSRKRRGEQRQTAKDKSKERMRDPSFDDHSIHPKARDASKFSFRKVFGLNATEQPGTDRSRDSVYLGDEEV